MKMQLLACVASLVALPAVAQSARVPVDPADGKSVSSMPAYRSSFADYRAWREPELTNWRNANDEVGAMRGHMGHVRGRTGETMIPGAAAAPSAKAEPSK